MKLLADEGVDSAVVTRLRSDGHDVVYVEMPGAFTVLSAGLVRIRPPR